VHFSEHFIVEDAEMIFERCYSAVSVAAVLRFEGAAVVSKAPCLPLHDRAGVGEAAAEHHHENVIAHLKATRSISLI
jgi:hypothetical protein